MAKRPRNRSERPSHPPLWLVEGLDIVHRKRLLLAAVVAAVVLVGAIVALLFPGVMPRTPEVGAAIGLAALLLGLAAAVATDATDLVVRGPRHVAAAGGELVAVLPREPSVAAAGPLAAAVLEVREPGVPLLLALATAGRDARRSNSWTDVIARALVAEGVGVLRVDLASGRSEQAGLVEVVRDGLRLADAVSFEPGLKLAHLSAGRDHAEALLALTELPGRLPRDLDIMLVSLPTAASRSVVSAATALDHVLVVVERDRTSRVDLIASLDALEAAGTHAQAVLLDTETALRLAPPVEAPTQEQGTRRRGISSTVGTAPVVPPGSEEAPVPALDDEGVTPGDTATEAAPSEGTGTEADGAAADLEEVVGSSDAAGEAASDGQELDEAGSEDQALDEEFRDDRGPDQQGLDEEPLDEDAADEAPPDAAFDGDRGADEAAGGPLPGSGPLAAGVAGAGVAAGLGAVISGRATDEDPDDIEPVAERDADDEVGAETELLADDEVGAETDRGSEVGAGTEVDAAAGDAGEATGSAGEQRDLELLEAAAAATAMSVAGAEDAPLDDHLETLPAPHDLEEELPQPGAAPLVEEVVELPAADAPGADRGAVDDAAEPRFVEDVPAGGDDLEQDDPTDRLPPVGAGDEQEEDLFAAGDEDLLRTTAQLAMLADDLELRSQGRLGPADAAAEAETARQADDDEHDGPA